MPPRGRGVTPFYERSGVTLYCGEALDVLRSLPDGSVDGVVTDPPYSSGGLFRGDRAGQTTTQKYEQTTGWLKRPEFSGDNRDQRSYGYWSALWLSECLRIAKPGSPICLFTDWRQLPTTTDMLQAGGWIWRGIVVWDKTEGARPNKGRFTAQSEFIVWGSAGPMPEPDPSAPCLAGVFRHMIRQADKHHQAGKPTPLLNHLLRIMPPGGVVLDPFIGSGTTAAAAIRGGYGCIGIELDKANVEVAAKRLAQDVLPLEMPA